MNVTDSSGVCNEKCDSPNCVSCMGLSQSSSYCARSGKTSSSSNCWLCSNKTQIYDYCTTGSCPPGFEVVSNLTSAFLGTNVCLRTVGSNSANNFFKIYVNTTGSPNGNGTITAPLNSISQAFALVTRRYTKIFIAPGSYFYFKETMTNNPLISDTFSPLNTVVNLYLEQL